MIKVIDGIDDVEVSLNLINLVTCPIIEESALL